MYTKPIIVNKASLVIARLWQTLVTRIQQTSFISTNTISKIQAETVKEDIRAVKLQELLRVKQALVKSRIASAALRRQIHELDESDPTIPKPSSPTEKPRRVSGDNI
jgi:hypothetical protein